jgi:hypothetical protein
MVKRRSKHARGPEWFKGRKVLVTGAASGPVSYTHLTLPTTPYV